VKILPVIMCGARNAGLAGVARKPSETIHFPHWLAFHLPDGAETLADEVFETPIVLSNAEYRFLVAEQLQISTARRALCLNRFAGIPACRRGRRRACRAIGPTRSSRSGRDHVVRDREGFVALCKRRPKRALAIS